MRQHTPHTPLQTRGNFYVARSATMPQQRTSPSPATKSERVRRKSHSAISTAKSAAPTPTSPVSKQAVPETSSRSQGMIQPQAQTYPTLRQTWKQYSHLRQQFLRGLTKHHGLNRTM